MAEVTLTTSAPATWRDGKKYLWPAALLVPVLPFASYGIAVKSDVAAWWWFGPAVVFLLIPIVDGFVGDDGGNPPEELVQART